MDGGLCAKREADEAGTHEEDEEVGAGAGLEVGVVLEGHEDGLGAREAVGGEDDEDEEDGEPEDDGEGAEADPETGGADGGGAEEEAAEDQVGGVEEEGRIAGFEGP